MKHITKEILKVIEAAFEEYQIELSSGEVTSFSDMLEQQDNNFDYEQLAKSIADKLSAIAIGRSGIYANPVVESSISNQT